MRLKIDARKISGELKLGDSVAVNGPCLTVTDLHTGGFTVEASAHTVSETTIGTWKIGRSVNLERALEVGNRLDGHIVQGHIDATGRVSRIKYGEGSTDIFVEAGSDTMKLMAPRGSVAIDGVSLTIAEKAAGRFKLMIVPFTFEHTNLGDLKPGTLVNIETDLIIRWISDRYSEQPVNSGDSKWSVFGGGIHLED